MNILDNETIDAIQQIIDNPPTCVEALNMAMGLHMRTSLEFRMKLVFMSKDSADVQETQLFIDRFMDVLRIALESDLPFAVEQHAELEAAASPTEDDDEEECDCPSCRFRMSLVQSLVAKRDANPEAGGEIVEDVYSGTYMLMNRNRTAGVMVRGAPNYGNNPFQARPRTFTVPGNKTVH